jgi:hypothetical protein
MHKRTLPKPVGGKKICKGTISGKKKHVDLWQKISEEDICRKPNGISLLTVTFAKAVP